MDVKTILSMSSKDITKLSDKELKRATTILNSAANKRLKRAYQKGMTSDVMERVLENGKFSIKGADTRTEIENSFMRARGYLEKETSSITGIKKSQNKMFKELAKEVNKELPEGEKVNASNWTSDATDAELKELSDLVWSQVDKLAENKQYNIGKSERYKIAAHAFQVATRDRRPIHTKRGMFKNLKKFYEESYIKSVEDSDDLGELSAGEKEVASIFSSKGFT